MRAHQPLPADHLQSVTDTVGWIVNRAAENTGEPAATITVSTGTDGTPMLRAAGPLTEVSHELLDAIGMSLADHPPRLVCDLSGVIDDRNSAAIAVIASAGQHARAWPATPITLICPAARLRVALLAQPDAIHLHLVRSAKDVQQPTASPDVVMVTRLLRPRPQSARDARIFLTRTLLDLRVAPSPVASLVLSELVTNSVTHAATDMDLTLEMAAQQLRIGVRDHSLRHPVQRRPGLKTHGRGLLIVSRLSDAHGVLPTWDGGKVVWAVLPLDRNAREDTDSLTGAHGG